MGTLQEQVSELLNNNTVLMGKFYKVEESLQATSSAASVRPAGRNPMTRSFSTSTSSRVSISPSFEFRMDLFSSRVYRGVKRSQSVLTLTSSEPSLGTWSVFSAVSLAEISVISAIALPVYDCDLANPETYAFGCGNDDCKAPDHDIQRKTTQQGAMKDSDIEAIERIRAVHHLPTIQIRQVHLFESMLLVYGKVWEADPRVSPKPTGLALFIHALSRKLVSVEMDTCQPELVCVSYSKIGITQPDEFHHTLHGQKECIQVGKCHESRHAALERT